MFGVKGGGDNFFEGTMFLFHQIPDMNTTVSIFGILVILVLILGEKFAPRRPIAILIVILSIILIAATSLGNPDFKTVGIIPTGLPEFSLPSISILDVDVVLPLAMACFLWSYIENVSAGCVFNQ